jgi:hypothetical protein
MFASIRRYRLIEGPMQELVRRVDDGFAELLRAQPGFVSYEFVDCGDGAIVTISLFATEPMADMSSELAEQWTESALDDMRFERIEMLHGEVLVSRAREEMLKATHAQAGKVASIRRYRLSEGSVGDLMHVVDEVFAPQIEDVEGIQAYHALDCGKGELFAITLCRDRATAGESDQLARLFVAEHLGAFSMERVEAMTGDVLVTRAIERLLEPAHA